jgi:hypothetical protein
MTNPKPNNPLHDHAPAATPASPERDGLLVHPKELVREIQTRIAQKPKPTGDFNVLAASINDCHAYWDSHFCNYLAPELARSRRDGAPGRDTVFIREHEDRIFSTMGADFGKKLLQSIRKQHSVWMVEHTTIFGELKRRYPDLQAWAYAMDLRCYFVTLGRFIAPGVPEGLAYFRMRDMHLHQRVIDTNGDAPPDSEEIWHEVEVFWPVWDKARNTWVFRGPGRERTWREWLAEFGPPPESRGCGCCLVNAG